MGIAGLCSTAHPSMFSKTYLDENSMKVGAKASGMNSTHYWLLIMSGFGTQDALHAKTMGAMHTAGIVVALQDIGLEVYTQDFNVTTPFKVFCGVVLECH